MLRARPLALPAPLVLLASLCLLALALPATAGAEDLESQLEAKQERLEAVHEREDVLTTTISGYKQRINHLIGVVAAIRTREAATAAALAAKEAELTRARAALAGSKQRLARVRASLGRAMGILKRRLVAIYESGSPDLLSVIVGAEGVDDLAASAEYLNAIHGQDEAVVGRVRDLRNEVRELVLTRLNAKVTIERGRDQVAAQQRSLAASRAQLQQRSGELVAARGDREAALATVGEHAEELDGSVAAIQGEIAAELAATGAAPLPAGPIVPGSGEMIWPVNGPIASPFGPREINGSYEYHPGIDIAVPEGTPIRAALAGTVAFTESEAESGGYGNYTCIEHGGGLSTCYAHQSAFSVNPGDSVEQGEVIGYTGCTGYCLGPHLHFEVRINGEVTDPMGYL